MRCPSRSSCLACSTRSTGTRCRSCRSDRGSATCRNKCRRCRASDCPRTSCCTLCSSTSPSRCSTARRREDPRRSDARVWIVVAVGDETARVRRRTHGVALPAVVRIRREIDAACFGAQEVRRLTRRRVAPAAVFVRRSIARRLHVGAGRAVLGRARVFVDDFAADRTRRRQRARAQKKPYSPPHVMGLQAHDRPGPTEGAKRLTRACVELIIAP
jgi:hypothetical protein